MSMIKSFTQNFHYFLQLILILSVVVAFLRTHSRIKTTLLGYEIGRMKDQEEQLLKRRSLLMMELAKITTKKNLTKKTRAAP